MFSGDLLFAGSIGRTDLPGGDHPTMLRSLRDQGAAAAPTTSWCCPATASRRPSAASARPTRSCWTSSDDGVRRAESPEDSDAMSQAHPAERVPRAAACRSASSSAGDRRRCARTFELHGFANIETRAVEPLDRLAKGGEIDKEIYVLRRLQADDGAGDAGAGPALRPDRAVRPLRAGERRQAGVPVPPLPDPAGLARRAAAGGPLPRSSPRPTSTSSAATSCRSTTTSRWCG